jgi:hypothetical protein
MKTKKRPSLIWAICKCFWLEYTILGFIAAFNDLGKFLTVISDFKFKFFKNSKLAIPKVFSYYLLGDFGLANFIFLPDLNLKLCEKSTVRK